ncbi:HAL/PAL/TAL family ammonia-lyase [Pseudomonas sessilinigenes]|uniref:Aromatic amino acid ammonia-lyase n=1 Tax=Pseudomonas sessilinigenes TaxID=658629 RepID=A0ABX8MYK3_9PSED|nr:aromatic amino acid ammonia-lyase [Pseudomonas sessilinigenes]AZC24468.1 Histidine ammonia-lyase [Pseudomonas sessilinigenes]QXH43404.1 aromatic amino acid ammonia-lyase [Pseudomonas sessilinigenes]
MSAAIPIIIDARFFSPEDLVAAARSGCSLRLDPGVVDNIDRAHRFVLEIAGSDALHYGINTGFGSLCTTHIDPADLSTLQHNLLKSHACGVGAPVTEEISRLVTLIKLLTFRSGNSGVSLSTVTRIVDLWNHGVVGAIAKKGTVGASGDLAPLAHLFLPLIGLGEVWHRGVLRPSAQVLQELGLAPLTLQPKDGLCLTNGVQYLNALGALATVRAKRLVALADLCAAMSMMGFSAARSFVDPQIHQTCLHPERSQVARHLRLLTQGSNHADLPHCNPAMEDPYSFRCAPQVHGAARQVVGYLENIIGNECNSVSDNPLVFPDTRQILTCGNLHGQSTAFALDFAAIGISDLSNISERRTYQLLSGQNGLPGFLVAKPGLNSGFMIAQYTSAALLNENKVLSNPASVDTVPTCHLQEDHVSMGGTSAYKLETVLDNCETILAIELLTACQAIDMNPGLQLSERGRKVHAAVREEIPFVREDQLMADLIGRAQALCHESPVIARQLAEIQDQ